MTPVRTRGWLPRVRAWRRGIDLLAADRAVALRARWRRSMLLRVVVSTVALAAVVVLVLGLVLQTQIADRLLQGKQQAALLQADLSRQGLERDLATVDPDREGSAAVLSTALDRLTATSGGDSREDAASGAGAFEVVVISGSRTVTGSAGLTTTPADAVPTQLREPVLKGFLATQYVTVEGSTPGSATRTLVVGQPVRTAGRNLQLYLLFPLTAEQRTLALVLNTLAVGGVVLLVVLAAISSLVTRQVVRPVRQAADVAERFADGHLEERMPVTGDDELGRLAESYNEMAASVQSQIRQLEEFGTLQRQFTSDVSHELRTPLTTVRMAAEVLADRVEDTDVPDPVSQRSARLLVGELDRFESLLGDLLEISRLDAGVAELAPEPVDVRGVVRRAAETVRALAETTGTPVVLDLDEEAVAEVDARRLERILRNLLANAIDHGESRPVEVRLGLDEQAVAILVRDHGIGLRDGEAALVFNRFWRADSSRQRRSGGTGLGLAIALEDARLHGGWLQAWGERGHGAAFRLTLPRRHGELLTASPLALVPVEASPAPADPGITDAAPTSGTALPPHLPESSSESPSSGPSFPEPSFPEPSFPEPSFPEPSSSGPSFPEPSFPEPSSGPSFPEPATPGPTAADPTTPGDPDAPDAGAGPRGRDPGVLRR